MTNALGIHAFTWSSPWTMQDGCRAIERAAALGFDVIAIPLRDMTVIDTAVVAKTLSDNGIGSRAALGMSLDADISSPDREVAERGAAKLKQAIAVTRDLGATYLGGVIYSALTKHSAAPTPIGRQHCVELLAAAAEQAKQAGLVLAVEPVNRYETNLVNTAAQAVALIDQTGADNIKLHLDTFHMNIEESDIGAVIRQFGSRLGYFEFSESHRGYLGTGQVNFQPAFQALAEIGYSGQIGFEAFTSNRARPSLAAVMALWRPLWDDADDIAAHARDFIRVNLVAAHQARRLAGGARHPADVA